MNRLLGIIVAITLLAAPAFGQTIKIGGIFDRTGATGDVGGPYAQGARDYIDYVNKKGGVNGKKIELFDVDYAYKIPQAQAAYKDMLSKGVVAILGWGTGDTEAMAPMIANDKIPYLSASYSEHLIGDKTPYNFVGGTTYSDQARIALKWIKDNWKDKSRAPKIALIYNDTGFGRSHLEDTEAFAKKVGVEVVDKQIVDLKALDATTQLLNMKQKNPDFALIQETTNATATILKDAKKLSITTKFIGLVWTFSEKTVQVAGPASDGFYGISGFSFWNEDKVDGVKFMKQVRKEISGKTDAMPVNYVQGFSAAYILVEALKKAGGNITGENIKKVLESSTIDTKGLTPTVAYKPGNKKPSNSAKILVVKGGQITPVTGFLKQ